MEDDNHQPTACNEGNCRKEATLVCLCSNPAYYLCNRHYICHIKKFEEKAHEPRQIIPTNPKVLDSLIKKANWIIEETAQQMDICKNELRKLEIFYEKVLANISHTKKMLIKELQGTINSCNIAIEKAKIPIFRKHYYDQLEFLLTTFDLSYADNIISQMKPPKIDNIILDSKNMWEKISFYSATFSHLLNNYNSYIFDIIPEKEKKTNLLVYFDGIQKEKYELSSIEPSSRMMLISPNDVLITGGLNIPTKCQIFNIERQCLIPQNDMNYGRYWHCCIFIKGFPTVIGGTYDKKSLKTVESLKYGKWYEIAPLIHPRTSPSASAYFGKVYVVGGHIDHYCEVFDEATDKWEELIWYMPYFQRISPGSINICENFLIIFGGCSNPNIPLKEAVKVDTKNNQTSCISLLEEKGKFSYCSHILKDGLFFSSMNYYGFHEFIQWELKEEINFTTNSGNN